MNQFTPKVSVIITCYNLGQYLDEAVDSVLSQTYKNFDIIIVNDGSKDEYTINLLNDYTQPKTRVINTENQGVAAARNLGIASANGLYILPLDADDKIGSTYLEKAVDALDNNENLGIVYCEAELFGEINGKWELPEYNFPKIILGNVIFCAALFRKSDWEQVNGYNRNMIYGREDHDFWLSIIEIGREVYRIPEVMFFYRQRSNSRDKSMKREHLIHSYSQLFINHPQLYSDNIEIIFEHLVDLQAKVGYLEERLQEIQVEKTLDSLNLKEINLIVFPDWCQPEDYLISDLEQVIRALVNHPDKSYMTLLVDIRNIADRSEIDANLILSSVVMNIIMQDNVDTEGLDISLVGKLSEVEWKALLPRLNCRLVLANENEEFIKEMSINQIKSCTIDACSNQRLFQTETVDCIFK